MKDKIAELEKRHCICGPEYTDRGLTSPDCRSHEFAADILALFKNIQVEVDCPECKGAGLKCNCTHQRAPCPICNNCKGSKTVTRPATTEEMKKGGILKIKQ